MVLITSLSLYRHNILFPFITLDIRVLYIPTLRLTNITANVGFGVLVAVNTKHSSTIFWDVTRCPSVVDHQRFGYQYSLYLQGRIIGQAITQQETGGRQSLLLDLEGIPPKRHWTSTGLHATIPLFSLHVSCLT
jgi:hypothetical protein